MRTHSYRILTVTIKVDTREGEVIVHFAPDNEFGVLDHSKSCKASQKSTSRSEWCRTETGTQVELMLFRRGELSEEDFDNQIALFKEDLHSLKMILEASLGSISPKQDINPIP
jgi:hypothetical protein